MKTTCNFKYQQQGAALVVGLIVLLIMTLLGISSMSASTAELKMASNLQTQDTGFQAVETAIELVLDGAPTGRIASIGWGVNSTTEMNDIAGVPVASGTVDVDATFTYIGCTNTPAGYELGSGIASGGSFKGLVHDIQITATMLGAASIAIGQGRVVVGTETVRPGCPDVKVTPTKLVI